MSGEAEPLITVVVAAYRPGDGLDRVLHSLDAQTLPQDRFETIIVDDGSPDDTWQRLEHAAATRPNMRIHRIPNSGWPSRPRNVATEMARGRWLLFMDHDDSLYPDALRRAAEYAAETDADLLSPKESKTSDVWWGMSSLEDGNIADVQRHGGIDRLLPMVPHKFYRRDFLNTAGIRFPEGRRMLWEDIYVNVEAYAKAQRVAVLADTPVYLWHSSTTNNSKTYGPRDAEFWDRLDDLLAFVDGTLAGPELGDARRTMLLHQYRGRVVGRFTRMLDGATPDEIRMALARARRIQDTYIPVEWDGHLGPTEAARSVLLRAERTDLLRELAVVDGAVVGRAVVTGLEWEEPRLRIDADVRWERRGGGPAPFVSVGGRVLRDLPPAIAAALPPELRDVTDRLADFGAGLGIRSRAERVTWDVPATWTREFAPVSDGIVSPVAHGSALLDPSVVAGGRPLDAPVWDFYAVSRWIGASRGSGLRSGLAARSAVLGGRGVVVYANLTGNLSLDRSSTLRNVVKDGRPDLDALTGEVSGFVLPLAAVAAPADDDIPCRIGFASDSGTVDVAARIVADGGAVRLEGGGPVPAGTYRLWFAVGGGVPLESVLVAHVAHGGGLRLERMPPAAPPASAPGPTRAQALRRRLRGVARAARNRLRRG